jgi:hypothetical protein
MIGQILKAAGVVAGGAVAATAGAFAQKFGEAVVNETAKKVVDTSLNKMVEVLTNQWSQGAGQNYISKTQSVRIEPFTLIDSRATRLPYMKDVMNVAQRLFTSYYLLSVASDNKIGGVKVSKYLDKFAPDRDLTEASKEFLSLESYQFGLPFVGEAAGLDRYSDYTTEAFDPTKGSKAGDGATFSGSTAQTLKDVGNLAVGQIVDVKIQDGVNSATIPVSIRLRTIGMEPNTLVELLSLVGTDNSSSARWRKFKVGELTLWKDLVMAQDRIDDYRRAVVNDKSGYFRKAHSRVNRGIVANMLTSRPSIGDATSICIITKDTQREVESKMNGRFGDFATRQAMFEGGLMMLLFVIDSDLETVTVYTRDIEDYGVYTMQDIKQASPSSGNTDLSDIMRSYLEGKVPGRL